MPAVSSDVSTVIEESDTEAFVPSKYHIQEEAPSMEAVQVNVSLSV